MAAEICFWVDAGRDSLGDQTYRAKLQARPSGAELARLKQCMQDVESALGSTSETAEDGERISCALRLAGAVVQVAVPWDRLVEAGALLESVASRRELVLYFPDAAVLGSDPSAPEWSTVQSTALRQLEDAWRAGHAIESRDRH